MASKIIGRPASGLEAISSSRRQFLQATLGGLGLFLAGNSLSGCGGSSSANSSGLIADLGPLGAPDENGVRLPLGFQSRVVARSGEPPTTSSDYLWPLLPDGGATFPTGDGGWIYVSNSEAIPGGVGALRFSSSGEIVDAYPILEEETLLNCAGGLTPWGTWLSCEEWDVGVVWECDPTGRHPAILRKSLGVFKHEAAAVDPATGNIYMTEDQPDGRLYRYRPRSRNRFGQPDLTTGSIDVARIVEGESGAIVWHELPDPEFTGETPTRHQIPESTPFIGGEGIWYHEGLVVFSTKTDNRIWQLDLRSDTIGILYDPLTSPSPVLTGVDNVTVSQFGEILVAEDGGNMELCLVRTDGGAQPICEIIEHPLSEITGPAFDPSGNRLYLSSQLGPTDDISNTLGITYEISGPFHSRT